MNCLKVRDFGVWVGFYLLYSEFVEIDFIFSLIFLCISLIGFVRVYFY